jgi:6-phosphogluconolactonase
MRLSLLFLAAATLAAQAAPLRFAIGTNSGGSGHSEGIYLSTFDPGSGEFTDAVLGAKYSNANFLALSPDKPLLYSVGNSAAAPHGSVAVFKIAADGLEMLAEAPSGGNGPCHLAVSPDSNTLAVANYSDGMSATIHLTPDGLFGKPGSALRLAGTGPRGDRQDGPHAHEACWIGSEVLFVPDLGLDKVLAWKVNPADSTFVAHKPAGWAGKPGAGPRHLAFSPDNKNVYVVNELENTVTPCTVNVTAGSMETLQDSLSTLPADWKGNSTTAEITVHPNGRFVYASNRGHDSIAVFQRDPATGKLTSLQIAPCGGKVPRNFVISPDGRWIICAHQDTNTISALPIDISTGLLGDPKTTMSAPNPVCIQFLP